MNHETDKLEQHHLLQLSALMDGELPPDQARFLLRRLEHDEELAGCWDRWQLCGEILRGQAQATAPAGFSRRVALAVAAEKTSASTRLPAVAANDASVGSRHRLARWGGGALAASMALVALFMARYQAVDESAPAASAVAAQSSAPSPAPAEPTVTSADAAGLVVVATVASAPLRTESPRRSATRTRQAARATAAARAEREPVRVAAASALPPVPPPSAPVLAAQAQPLPSTSPFLPPADETPAARPWPRSSLPQYPATGMFSAGLSSSQAGRSFYPFEPRLSSPPPAETAEPSRQE